MAIATVPPETEPATNSHVSRTVGYVLGSVLGAVAFLALGKLAVRQYKIYQHQKELRRLAAAGVHVPRPVDASSNRSYHLRCPSFIERMVTHHRGRGARARARAHAPQRSLTLSEDFHRQVVESQAYYNNSIELRSLARTSRDSREISDRERVAQGFGRAPGSEQTQGFEQTQSFRHTPDSDRFQGFGRPQDSGHFQSFGLPQDSGHFHSIDLARDSDRPESSGHAQGYSQAQGLTHGRAVSAASTAWLTIADETDTNKRLSTISNPQAPAPALLRCDITPPQLPPVVFEGADRKTPKAAKQFRANNTRPDTPYTPAYLASIASTSCRTPAKKRTDQYTPSTYRAEPPSSLPRADNSGVRPPAVLHEYSAATFGTAEPDSATRVGVCIGTPSRPGVWNYSYPQPGFDEESPRERSMHRGCGERPGGVGS